jgi:hypothetical protein
VETSADYDNCFVNTMTADSGRVETEGFDCLNDDLDEFEDIGDAVLDLLGPSD